MNIANQSIKQAVKRFAAIDIGTVTCRLLIADADVSNSDNGDSCIKLRNVAKEYAVTNLGEGVDATCRLKDEAIERVASALLHFKDVMRVNSDDELPISKTIVMSTSAARDAENSADFIERLRSIGFELDVIPGEKEASLSFAGATSRYAGDNVMVVDVGGGSTEISIGVAGQSLKCSKSFNIGCRRVTERFLKSDPPSTEEMREARNWMRTEFKNWFDGDDVKAQKATNPIMIAVAGTATSAVSMRDHMEVYDSEKVDGATVAIDDLRSITKMLASMTLEERKHVVGLDPRRAPVIVAGMLILEEIMQVSQVDAFTVSESDILDGMILDAIKNAD